MYSIIGTGGIYVVCVYLIFYLYDILLIDSCLVKTKSEKHHKSYRPNNLMHFTRQFMKDRDKGH